MKKKILTLMFLLLVAPIIAFGAGSVTLSSDVGGSFYTFTWTCTSDASGDISGEGEIVATGYPYQVEVIPDDAGDVIFTGNNQPTTGFNVELRGTLNEDVLYDVTSACSNSALTRGTPLTSSGGLVLLKGDTLTPYASGVGNAKKFYLKVKIIKP